jgi:hypothetical protein
MRLTRAAQTFSLHYYCESSHTEKRATVSYILTEGEVSDG